jgi:hypothetical protein
MQPTAVIFFTDPLALVILLCALAALRMQKDDGTIAITSIAAVVTNIVSLYISIERAKIYLRVSIRIWLSLIPKLLTQSSNSVAKLTDR